MFKKINTRYLLIAFVALLVLVLLTIPTSNSKKNHSFKSELTDFDTSRVNAITIYPKAGGDLINFEKDGHHWEVSGKDGTYNADKNQVKNILQTFASLKAKRLAAKDKDSWKKYELTDSLATRIEFREGKKTMGDVYVGKFSYTQPPQPTNPYQQPQGTMTSYVRLNGKKEVYGVDGFLSMSVNRSVKDFRDAKVLQAQKTKIQQITVTAPNNSYTKTKNDSIWMVNGMQADSATVVNYLSGLSYVRSSNFISNDKKPVGTANYHLKLEGENGNVLAQVEAYYNDSTQIAISSSMNEGTWFDGTKADLFTKLFKDKADFTQF